MQTKTKSIISHTQKQMLTFTKKQVNIQTKTLIYTDDIFISIVILDISNAPLSFLIFRNVYIGGQK